MDMCDDETGDWSEGVKVCDSQIACWRCDGVMLVCWGMLV
jgi:hypothetical protein